MPYRGTNQAMVDLMEGRIDILFGTIPPTLQYIRAGSMRALARDGKQAVAAPCPRFATIDESGIPGYELSLWQAIVAPSAVSPAIVGRLNREVAGILSEPDTIALLEQQGVEVAPYTPDALGRLIAADIEKWRNVINDPKRRQ